MIEHTRYDILHPTYYHPYVLNRMPADRRLVITVHDMIHELFSSQFPDAELVKQQKLAVCNAADRLIAISENTKRDMMNIWGIDEKKIDVVHHGLMWNDDIIPRKASLPFSGDYILYVGDRLAKYKNFEEFVVGVAPVLKKYRLHLVCTGRDFRVEEHELLRKNGIEDISLTIMADEGVLYDLYRRAACFVFPSRYEGFGIPILESFKARCPILLSRASCFPEIAADAAEYYEVGHPDSLSASLTSILDDSEKCDIMRQKGSERLAQFSVEKMIEGTKAVYERVI